MGGDEGMSKGGEERKRRDREVGDGNAFIDQGYNNTTSWASSPLN